MTTNPAGPTDLVRTRLTLHRLAEHVVSPARRTVTGRIGLVPAPGGFATPPFGDDGRVVGVDGLELVVRDATGEQRAPLTTLRAAARLAGVPDDVPDADAPLELDPAAVAELARWWQLGFDAIAALLAEIPGGDAVEVWIWPEHFDVGTAVDRVNYGASPGDDTIPQPYLYVGPWDGPPSGDPFWNAPFGAARTAEQISGVAHALQFLREGRRRAETLPPADPTR